MAIPSTEVRDVRNLHGWPMLIWGSPFGGGQCEVGGANGILPVDQNGGYEIIRGNLHSRLYIVEIARINSCTYVSWGEV